jgi:hypothetical protein
VLKHIADGILDVLHPSFVPPPEPEVIDVDNNRNVRQRAAPDTTNDALLQPILQLEENLADQRRREEQLRTTHQAMSTAAPAQLRSSLRNPTTGPLTTGQATFDLPFDRVVSEYERRAEDAIERYKNISSTRTLTPKGADSPSKFAPTISAGRNGNYPCNRESIRPRHGPATSNSHRATITPEPDRPIIHG